MLISSFKRRRLFSDYANEELGNLNQTVSNRCQKSKNEENKTETELIQLHE